MHVGGYIWMPGIMKAQHMILKAKNTNILRSVFEYFFLSNMIAENRFISFSELSLK